MTARAWRGEIPGARLAPGGLSYVLAGVARKRRGGSQVVRVQNSHEAASGWPSSCTFPIPCASLS
jgi:hypothetical protein